MGGGLNRSTQHRRQISLLGFQIARSHVVVRLADEPLGLRVYRQVGALWKVERLVRRSSQSEGGSDTHQLHLMEMMGFAGSTHPTY